MQQVAISSFRNLPNPGIESTSPSCISYIGRQIFTAAPPGKLHILFLIILFIYDCAGSSLSCQLFSSRTQRELLSGASHYGGFPCCRPQALKHLCISGSQVLEHRLNSCGIDSLPLSHHGSPLAHVRVQMLFVNTALPTKDTNKKVRSQRRDTLGHLVLEIGLRNFLEDWDFNPGN